jgi:hypothetical protein
MGCQPFRLTLDRAGPDLHPLPAAGDGCGACCMPLRCAVRWWYGTLWTPDVQGVLACGT